MLINLSNHPSDEWPENQITLAMEIYGAVLDLAFPQIPPEMDSEGLDAIVGEYFDMFVQTDLEAVHIMGEMTFTYRLVDRLKRVGIPCIASTTQRISTIKDGTKTSVFKFVQFREY